MFHNDMYGYVPRRNPLATASMVLGILSLCTCFIFYLSLPFGALAILLAILSRIERNMSGKGKAGIICGLCGIIVSIAVTVSSVYFVLTDATARSYLEYYLQIYTGDSELSLEEEFGNLFPFISEGESSDSNQSSLPSDGYFSEDSERHQNQDRSNVSENPEIQEHPGSSDTPASPKKEGTFL